MWLWVYMQVFSKQRSAYSQACAVRRCAPLHSYSWKKISRCVASRGQLKLNITKLIIYAVSNGALLLYECYWFSAKVNLCHHNRVYGNAGTCMGVFDLWQVGFVFSRMHFSFKDGHRTLKILECDMNSDQSLLMDRSCKSMINQSLSHLQKHS